MNALQGDMQLKERSAAAIWAHVYVIRSGGYRKIGYTANLKSRLAQMQTNSPTELVVDRRYVVDRRFAAIAEFLLHERLQHRHVRGEWFTADLAEIDDVYTLHVVPQLRLQGAMVWEELPRPQRPRRKAVRRKQRVVPLAPWQADLKEDPFICLPS